MFQLVSYIPALLSILILFYYFQLETRKEKGMRLLVWICLCILIEAVVLTMNTSAQYQLHDIKYSTIFSLTSFISYCLFLAELIKDKKENTAIICISYSFIPLWITYSWYTSTQWGNNNFWDKTENHIQLALPILLSFSLFFYLFSLKRKYKSMDIKTNNFIYLSIAIVQTQSIGLLITLILQLKKISSFTSSFYFYKSIQVIALLSLYFFLFDKFTKQTESNYLNRLNKFSPLQAVFSEYKNTEAIQESQNKEVEIKPKDNIKYQRSLISEAKLKEYTHIVEAFFIKNDNIWLNPNFTLKTLSEHTKLSKHQLSQVFNLGIGSTFPRYLNKHRIQYACQIIQSSTNEIPTIQLTEICGYRSRSSFYKCFQEHTGMLPSEYKNKHKAH